ncbi:uncharacterized protein [Chironomus tepperi]|uniref:uncharacterized protein n=1 Tax=Chironomus tepperi TaxID=113505 RepID=UPI00391F1025
MMVKLSVQYSSNKQKIINSCRYKTFDTLVIDNVPSVKHGIELISSGGILAYHEIHAVILRVNEKLDPKLEFISKIFTNDWVKSILISFTSLTDQHESISFWKLPGNSKFYSIYIDDDKNEAATNYVHDFLTKEIMIGKTGIISKSNKEKSNLDFFDIGDEDGNNLLYYAAKDNNLEAVESFLFKGLNPEDNENSPAINAAWEKFSSIKNDQQEKENNEKIMILLLNANSRFPTFKNWFTVKNIPRKVKDFLDKSENLHLLVDRNDFITFSEELNKNGNLIYNYNRHNESIFIHGLKAKKYDIIKFIKHGLSAGPCEDLEEVYYETKNIEEIARRRQTQIENLENSIALPNAHLIYLLSKSRLFRHNNNLTKKLMSKLNEAFEIIDNNNYCSKILKIAASWNQIVIYFDCSSVHTMFMDPLSSIGTQAYVNSNGRILIGAKNLFYENSKLSGVIIHELCHAAMLLIYRNSYNPYTESNEKSSYEQKAVVECIKNKNSDTHVGDVLVLYKAEHQPAEFIVTYPQILMEYHNDRNLLEIYETNFQELIQYSLNIIEPELERGLLVLNMLQDNSRIVKFNDLTQPLKQKILNTKVLFKDSNYTLRSLYNENPDIVDRLASNDIKDFLIKSCPLKLSDNSATVYERKFVNFRNFGDDHQRSIKDLNQLNMEITSTKAIIIFSIPGFGVSTFLKQTEVKLKKYNTDTIVTYLNLKDHTERFDNYINEKMNINLVIEIFGSKNLKDDIRAIYLLDGLDQIWTKYGDLWIDIFETIKKHSKIELWISVKSQQIQQIEKIFNTQVVRFAPFTHDEIKDFISINMKTSAKPIIEEYFKKIIEFLKYLETSKGQFFELEMNNLQFIRDITCLYNDKRIIPDPSNLFEIFFKINMKMDARFKSKDVSDIYSNISIQSVHEVLALKTIFGENYEHKNGFKLNELGAIKEFDSGNCWTFDVIQEYGIITKYPDISNHIIQHYPKVEGIAVTFIHKSFAEFYIAKYVINLISIPSYLLRDEESEKTLKLLEILAENSQKFHRIHEFIFSSKKINQIGERIKKIITDNIPRYYREMTTEKFEFFAKICKNNQKLNETFVNFEKALTGNLESERQLINSGIETYNFDSNDIPNVENFEKSKISPEKLNQIDTTLTENTELDEHSIEEASARTIVELLSTKRNSEIEKRVPTQLQILLLDLKNFIYEIEIVCDLLSFILNYPVLVFLYILIFSAFIEIIKQLSALLVK